MSCHCGRLEITGTAPDNITTRWVRLDNDQRPNVPPDHAARLDDAILVAQAKDALVGLGWKSAIARAAVDEARAHVGVTATVEDLVRAALQRCPKPIARTS